MINKLIIKIYRIIAFQYKQPGLKGGIKVSMLSEMVSTMFYPYDLDPQAKQKFKGTIEQLMREAAGYRDEISEDEFVRLLVRYA